MTDRDKTDDPEQQIAQRLADANQRMEKSVEALHRELMTVRTGRASPALLERLHVDYYGSPTPLQSIAGISVPEASMLVIQPYDRTSLGAIEKAIQKSDLGLNPSNDGQVIRVAIPQLTEERRKDLVKVIHRKADEARVAVRNIRRDEVEHLRKMEKDGHVSKDDIERNIATVQHITDGFIGKIDHSAERKEAEILEV